MSDGSPSTSSSTAVAVGVSVAIVVVLVLSTGAFFYVRRRRSGTAMDEPEGRRSVVLERSHPASRVTPFGTANDAPRFNHKPGEAMRFARRRSDGGWDFSAPLDIHPPGVSPFADSASSICPSPTMSVSTSSFFMRKEKLPGELTTRGYVEFDVEGVPPPAYTPRIPFVTRHNI